MPHRNLVGFQEPGRDSVSCPNTSSRPTRLGSATLTPPSWQSGRNSSRSVLLEGDHVRAAQRWGFGLQRLVRQVAVELIQYLIETDDLLVVGGGRGRIHR